MAMSDKKQDAKVTKGMSPKQKATFNKADAKADVKTMSRKMDVKSDKMMASRIKGGKK